MYSLKARLLWTLLVILTLTMLCTGVATYFSLKSEVSRLLDGSMVQVADSLKKIRSQDITELEKFPSSYDQNIVVQIYDPISGLSYISRKMENLPIPDREGFSDIAIDGQPWRLYTAQNEGRQVIEVAQPFFLRNEMAFQAAKSILLPIFLAVPFMGLIVWLFVGRGFSLIRETAEAISRRSPTSMKPLSTKEMPVEMAPIGHSPE